MFAQVKRFCNKGHRKIGKLYNENSRSIKEEKKVEAFAEYYEDLYAENIPENPKAQEIIADWRRVKEEKSGIIFDELNTSLDSKEEELVRPDEVAGLIKNVNNKESVGKDRIPNCVLRKLPRIFAEISTILFNNCLTNGYFPRAWKEAVIIPIPKTACAKSVREHRPISLLANWG